MIQIPLDRLLFPPNMPAGMDWSVVGHFAMLLRKLPQPVDPPILVRPESCCCGEPKCARGYWRIVDGRHRTMAAMWSGRTHIDAEVEN